MPVQEEKTRRRVRTADLNRFRRIVSQKTIETCQELETCIGSAQALNYEHITGGQASQNASNMPLFVSIDYCADVLKAVKDTLDDDDLNWYLRLLKNPDPDFTRQTEAQMRIHERMGRVLLSRGLFTFTRYRNTVWVF